jgi:hypothetical protein
MRTLMLMVVVMAVPALADDGGDADAGPELPDASAGNGGSDQMTQESDEGGANSVCQLSRDCERGFTCTAGHCVYVGYRQATGCSVGDGALIFPAALWLAFSVRGIRRRRPPR